MIPAWLDPETSALMTTVHAECRHGPHDGRQQAVTADTDMLWIGPIKAAWALEAEAAPENLVGRDLHCYRRTDQVTGDGFVVYEWVVPSA